MVGKIEFIKELRRMSNCSLSDAKNFIDRVQAAAEQSYSSNDDSFAMIARIERDAREAAERKLRIISAVMED